MATGLDQDQPRPVPTGDALKPIAQIVDLPYFPDLQGVAINGKPETAPVYEAFGRHVVQRVEQSRQQGRRTIFIVPIVGGIVPLAEVAKEMVSASVTSPDPAVSEYMNETLDSTRYAIKNAQGQYYLAGRNSSGGFSAQTISADEAAESDIIIIDDIADNLNSVLGPMQTLAGGGHVTLCALTEKAHTRSKIWPGVTVETMFTIPNLPGTDIPPWIAGGLGMNRGDYPFIDQVFLPQNRAALQQSIFSLLEMDHELGGVQGHIELAAYIKSAVSALERINRFCFFGQVTPATLSDYINYLRSVADPRFDAVFPSMLRLERMVDLLKTPGLNGNEAGIIARQMELLAEVQSVLPRSPAIDTAS